MGSASYGLLPEMLIAWGGFDPEVTSDLRELPSLDQIRAFASRQLDAGLIRLPLAGAATTVRSCAGGSWKAVPEA